MFDIRASICLISMRGNRCVDAGIYGDFNLYFANYAYITDRFMKRHIQQLIDRGIPEDEFLTIADSYVWVRRAVKDGRTFASPLPTDVVGWPKSDKLRDVADHLDVRELAFGSSFRSWRDYYVQDWDVAGYKVVPVEALMGHLLARAKIIGRLARFLRGARIIELRADAKARAIRQEVRLIEEAAAAHRKQIGFLSINPVHRVKMAIRRSRLSVFQARRLASTEPGCLYVVRVDAEGTTTVGEITFRGEHRYGKWNVGSGEFSQMMLVTRQAKTVEIDLSAEFQSRLTASSIFIRPASVPALLEEIRHYQQEAITTSDVRSQVSDRDRSHHDQALARLSHLNETQRRRNQDRKRRIERQAKVTNYYRRLAGQSAQRLLATGVPVNVEELTDKLGRWNIV